MFRVNSVVIFTWFMFAFSFFLFVLVYLVLHVFLLLGLVVFLRDVYAYFVGVD